MKRILYFYALLTITLLGLSNVTTAKEVIENYHSDIVIESDSSLIVTETITVKAEGKQIKRGIYRDFPTHYKDLYGNNYRVKFNLLSVQRNGKDEAYHSEPLSNGIRIYMGEKNRFIEHEVHTYTIQFYTNRQLGFFEEHDELYWNVTGNDWAFPINNASATIHLPQGVYSADVSAQAFTGVLGAKEEDYVFENIDDQSVSFKSTQDLPVKHGLTIVINWPKGFVHEPTLDEKIDWFLEDNQATLIGYSGVAILLFYLSLAWLNVGKDPGKGVAYPLYQPDKAHSPASMRFVSRMGYDKKTFAAALVNMAVKGYVSITENDKYFTLKKIKAGQSAALATGEAVILSKLFSDAETITLKQSQHKVIAKAIKSHKTVLKRDYEKIYFLTNTLFLLPGWLITIITLVLTVLAIEPTESREIVAFFMLWLSFWSMGVTVLLFAVYTAWKKATSILSFFPALFITAFAAPFLAGEGFGLYMMWFNAGTGVLSVFVLLISINIFFYQWMKAPTYRGRKLLDRIDGFKMYLSVTESEDLKKPHGLVKTPELFELYFPYAMALDVENQWAERFSEVFYYLEQQDYHHSPKWYHGRHWDSNNLTGFSSAIGSGLSSAVSSSSTAPGSSGGGGGSSGGGGGGGGGGGW